MSLREVHGRIIHQIEEKALVGLGLLHFTAISSRLKAGSTPHNATSLL
jgi:hypothetical protein